jgi:hypothetical protein
MSDYTAAVDRCLEGIEGLSAGACPNCPTCLEIIPPDDYDEGADWGETLSEGAFSWSSCDSCGSNLGGDRYPAHGFYTDDKGQRQLIHLDICTDCLMLIANGDEPTDGPWAD